VRRRRWNCSPSSCEAFFDQITVVDKGMERKEFCARNTESSKIGGHLRMTQARKRAAIRFRHERVRASEPFHMHLVKDRPIPRNFRLRRLAPSECRIDNTALLHEGGTITLVKRPVLVGMAKFITEQFGSPPQFSHELLGIGIQY
jgi:hypothetical protein